ncbi:MAG: histidine phosphotransferase family protein [Hyphomicrobiales bacterium]|nr:histidine phosphotransferase family protein [Hyphomicrobiales bacterium]
MSDEGELSELELAALVSSRICHDVISPVGAISNGLEVLADESDEVMREHALDLIRKSAQQASAKLQFARLAFGAAGSAGAEIDLRDAEKVARGILDGGKHTIDWTGPVANLPKDKVKLLLNMVTIGLTTLPRGGAISVTVTGDAADAAFVVQCRGEHSRLPEEIPLLLAGDNGQSIDAHSIQPYYAGLIATAAGMSLEAASEADGVVLTARSQA